MGRIIVNYTRTFWLHVPLCAAGREGDESPDRRLRRIIPVKSEESLIIGHLSAESDLVECSPRGDRKREGERVRESESESARYARLNSSVELLIESLISQARYFRVSNFRAKKVLRALAHTAALSRSLSLSLSVTKNF